MIMAKTSKKPISVTKGKRDSIENAVVTDSLDNLISRAKDGELSASRTLLMSMSHYLHPKNEEPVPLIIRKYLSDGFLRILGGESADVVFNLKKNGRNKTPHKLKLRVSYFVYQGIHEHSLTVEEAVAETTELINERPMAWIKAHLKGEELQEERVRKWYYETLEELNLIYQKD
jgi:hypothetical protein